MAEAIAPGPTSGAFGRGWSIQRVAGYAAMALAVIIVGAPLFWMFSGSLKTTQEVFAIPPTFLPSSPRWSNYIDAWHAAPFGRFYLNSIIITFFGTGIKLINAVCTAYALVSVAKWNEFLWPLVITNTDDMRPLTVGLTYLVNRESNTQWGQVMAATVFVIVPLLIVFAFAQRLIIAGITAGATKG
jgi:ABC-type glycerol-3-phosphate transport system permease component